MKKRIFFIVVLIGYILYHVALSFVCYDNMCTVHSVFPYVVYINSLGFPLGMILLYLGFSAKNLPTRASLTLRALGVISLVLWAGSFYPLWEPVAFNRLGPDVRTYKGYGVTFSYHKPLVVNHGQREGAYTDMLSGTQLIPLESFPESPTGFNFAMTVGTREPTSSTLYSLSTLPPRTIAGQSVVGTCAKSPRSGPFCETEYYEVMSGGTKVQISFKQEIDNPENFDPYRDTKMQRFHDERDFILGSLKVK